MRTQLKKVTGFAIIGPDDPKTQKAYIKEREWKVQLYSANGTSFIKDMGFEDKSGDAEPGISVLQKDRKGKIRAWEPCHVDTDGRAPSVLEVLWMLPGIETEQVAFGK